MIVPHLPPLKPPQAATPKPVRPEPPREQRFAALLDVRTHAPPTATGLPNDAAPAYNRSDDQTHATSFEAMPLIAPMSVDLADPDAMQAMRAAPAVRTDAQGHDEPGAALDRVDLNSGEMRAPVAALGGSLPSAAAPAPLPRDSMSAARPPIAVAGSRPVRSPVQPAPPAERAGALRAANRSAPSPLAGEPFALALGAGVSVHVHTDGAQPRVAVRGLKVEGTDRGEIASRIARLMRAHGHEISEQAIDFEGGGQ